eukprot:gene7995-5555_t
MQQSTYRAGWAGAAALKDHCHRLFQTLGSATPPEAFLYRGNAYYALGFPYLALADYETAAKFLPLTTSRHQDKCVAAASRFPAQQVALYPGTNSHLHICVHPLLDPKCAVVADDCGGAVQHGSDRDRLLGLDDPTLMSRRVVATSRFSAAGMPVVKPTGRAPWLQYPLQDRSCARCCRRLGVRAFPCLNAACHEEYCSRDCRQLALQEYHAGVCTNTAFQGIEMDLYTAMQGAEEAVRHRHLAALLLSLRVLAAAVTMQSSPTALPQVRILSGRLSFAPIDLCRALLRDYQRIAEGLRVTTTISYEEFIGIYARVRTNADWVQDPTEIQENDGATDEPCCTDFNSVRLHLPYAIFNHSCEPNLVLSHPTSATAAPASESALHEAEVVTARPIESGEELTRSYFPAQWLKLPYAQRRGAMAALDFHCRCPRCLAQQ